MRHGPRVFIGGGPVPKGYARVTDWRSILSLKSEDIHIHLADDWPTHLLPEELEMLRSTLTEANRLPPWITTGQFNADTSEQVHARAVKRRNNL